MAANDTPAGPDADDGADELEVGVPIATGTVTRIRMAYDPLYAPLLGLGFLGQLVGLFLGPVVSLAGLAVASIADLSTAGERNVVRGIFRRRGLGLLQRVTLRAVLLLGAVTMVGAPTLAVAGYAVGILALSVVARGVQFLLGKVLRLRAAEGIANLGDDLELTGFFDRVARWRPQLIGIACSAELPLALGLVWASDGPGVGLAVLVITGIALAVGLVAVAVFSLRFQRSGRDERYREELQEAIRASGTEVVVYFSGDREATYQINQWMPVFEQLDRPLMFLLRERGHLGRMPETRWPVLAARRHADVEVALAADPKVVLYVGTAGKNIHFLRYGRPRHVFLNHGDSDKVSSANPVVKVYDQLFVAGQVGIDRYHAAGIDLDDDRFRIVGRPQLDRVLEGRKRIGEGPLTLLYAPTWEGYFDSADYSSLERMGPALIRYLLTNHAHVRIVFKPHPTSGRVRPGAKVAGEKVTAMLRTAGTPHVLAADQPELDLLDWFDRSDVLLSDISAVVTDFLQTDKPYLVTNPRGLAIEQFHDMFPSHRAAHVVAPDLVGFDDQVADAFGPDTLAADRAEMKLAVLGEHPDGPLAAFEAALDDAINWAERDAGRRVNTFSYE